MRPKTRRLPLLFRRASTRPPKKERISLFIPLLCCWIMYLMGDASEDRPDPCIQLASTVFCRFWIFTMCTHTWSTETCSAQCFGSAVHRDGVIVDYLYWSQWKHLPVCALLHLPIHHKRYRALWSPTSCAQQFYDTRYTLHAARNNVLCLFILLFIIFVTRFAAIITHCERLFASFSTTVGINGVSCMCTMCVCSRDHVRSHIIIISTKFPTNEWMTEIVGLSNWSVWMGEGGRERERAATRRRKMPLGNGIWTELASSIRLPCCDHRLLIFWCLSDDCSVWLAMS